MPGLGAAKSISPLAASFMSLADCYGAPERLAFLRTSAAALGLHTEREAAAWLSEAPPLPEHTKQAARRGAGALYAALRGLRQAKLAQALRRWSVGAVLAAAAAAVQMPAKEHGDEQSDPRAASMRSEAEALVDRLIAKNQASDEEAKIERLSAAMQSFGGDETIDNSRQQQQQQQSATRKELVLAPPTAEDRLALGDDRAEKLARIKGIAAAAAAKFAASGSSNGGSSREVTRRVRLSRPESELSPLTTLASAAALRQQPPPPPQSGPRARYGLEEERYGSEEERMDAPSTITRDGGPAAASPGYTPEAEPA